MSMGRLSEAEDIVMSSVEHQDCGLEMGLALCGLAAQASVEAANRAYSKLSSRFKDDSIFVHKIRIYLGMKSVQDVRAAFDEGTA